MLSVHRVDCFAINDHKKMLVQSRLSALNMITKFLVIVIVCVFVCGLVSSC